MIGDRFVEPDGGHDRVAPGIVAVGSAAAAHLRLVVGRSAHLRHGQRRVPDASADDLDPVSYWSEARVNPPPDPAVGPVQVAVTYTIASEQEEEWLTAMRLLRRSRMRTGATRWELYRDAEHPGRFVEQFGFPPGRSTSGSTTAG